MSDIKKSAEISPDGMYRYSLERTWDEGKPTVLFICLNPSTADAVEDDATVRRMVSFARQFGGGRLLVGNLFAFRSKNRNDLLKADDPVGPENDKYLDKLIELPPKKATLKEVAFCVKSIQLKRNNWSVLFLENSKVIEK